jgi:pullulanase/glycogen debranching enzyme
VRHEIPWLQHGQWLGEGLRVQGFRPDAQPLSEEDWQTPRTHLALLGALDGSEALLVLNAGDQTVSYTLPGRAGQPWREVVRTDREDEPTEPHTVTNQFEVPGRTVSLLVRQRDEGAA